MEVGTSQRPGSQAGRVVKLTSLPRVGQAPVADQPKAEGFRIFSLCIEMNSPHSLRWQELYELR